MVSLVGPRADKRRSQQEGKCFLCQKPLDGDETRDHLIPKSKGGSNNWNNIVIVHNACNYEKGDRDPTQEEITRFARMTGMTGPKRAKTKPPHQPTETDMDIQVPDSIDDLVDQFVKLRDKLKEADDQHKQRTKPARDHLEKLNGVMLERLNAVGGESVKTKSGTVYRTTRRSASIADGELFRRYVIENNEFDLVDWRANANAVDDFIKNNSTTPPGVNYSIAYTVGVRRA